MIQGAIRAADPGAIDAVAKSCGDLAVGCTAAATHVTQVAESLGRQMQVLADLEKVTASLEDDQRRSRKKAEAEPAPASEEAPAVELQPELATTEAEPAPTPANEQAPAADSSEEEPAQPSRKGWWSRTFG